MQPVRIERLFAKPWCSLTTLSSLILLKIVIQVSLYRAGFISVSVDEFARGLRAAMWALEPQVDIFADVQDVWLPLEKYLNGSLLILWPDPIVVPRVTVFIASCVTLVMFYLLIYHLFDSYPVAALSSLLVTFQPWYAWLSGTPMLEMYYFACFFAGLLFLVLWIRRGRAGYWLLAGGAFLLASGLHVQSWTLINLVNLLTLPYLYQLLVQRRFGRVVQLIGFYVLGNSLILAFAGAEFASSGRVFAFLENHTTYSRWFYRGYDVPVLEKLLYYPRLVAQHASVTLWIGLGLALLFLVRAQDRLWKLLPLLLVVVALTLNSTLNVFSGPPSAAPGRYSVFHVMLLSPYLAYATTRVLQWAQEQRSPFLSYPAMALAVVLFLYGIVWGAQRIPDFYPAMPDDTIDTGRRLHGLLEEEPGAYLLERRYWEYLAVQLMAGRYDDTRFDRELEVTGREAPSLFLGERGEVCRTLVAEEVRYVALIDESLKARVVEEDLLRPLAEIGRWTIYEFSGC